MNVKKTARKIEIEMIQNSNTIKVCCCVLQQKPKTENDSSVNIFPVIEYGIDGKPKWPTEFALVLAYFGIDSKFQAETLMLRTKC